jgi:biotin carboxylase
MLRSMGRSAVLILPKTSYRADDFFRAARRLGVEVIVASDRCHQLAELWPASAEQGPELVLTQTLPLPFRDPYEAARQLAEQVRDRQPAAVVGVDDETAVIAALTADRLGLPHNAVGAVEAANNKACAREMLRGAGVPVPWFEVVDRDSPRDALENLAARLQYPCVIKPLALSASRGVIRADDPASFLAAFDRVAALLRSPQVAERGHPELALLLVEGFLPGPEVALEGLLSKGDLQILAVFDKPDPLEGPFFEETLYVTPSRYSRELQREIAQMALRAAAALGLRDGPIHAELRLTPEGPRILEVAARSIGGLCGRTLRFGSGASLEEVILRHALGEPPPAEREQRAAGVLMLPIPRRGVLKEVRGVAAARAIPLVEDVVITAPIDQEVVPLPEGASYLGFAFARGDTPGAVEAALRAAHRELGFLIAPVLPTRTTRATP